MTVLYSYTVQYQYNNKQCCQHTHYRHVSRIELQTMLTIVTVAACNLLIIQRVLSRNRVILACDGHSYSYEVWKRAQEI
jgi:hypothetical protein